MLWQNNGDKMKTNIIICAICVITLCICLLYYPSNISYIGKVGILKCGQVNIIQPTEAGNFIDEKTFKTHEGLYIHIINPNCLFYEGPLIGKQIDAMTIIGKNE
jgi:hypothetical protein